MSFLNPVASVLRSKSMGSVNTISALYQAYKITSRVRDGQNWQMSEGYRPRQWEGTSDIPELLNTSSPLSGVINHISNGILGSVTPKLPGISGGMSSELVYVKTNIGGFFFDAILNEEHESELTITEHPVQTGAAVTDHSFLNPSLLTMEVAMSDAMATMVPGQFTEYYTKSVSAYEKLRELQAYRIPLEVHTRLHHYENMLIQSLRAPDDYKTLYGLRCTVVLQEIFVVNVQEETVSARNWSTGSTNRAEVQPQPVDTDAANGSTLYNMEL